MRYPVLFQISDWHRYYFLSSGHSINICSRLYFPEPICICSSTLYYSIIFIFLWNYIYIEWLYNVTFYVRWKLITLRLIVEAIVMYISCKKCLYNIRVFAIFWYSVSLFRPKIIIRPQFIWSFQTFVNKVLLQCIDFFPLLGLRCRTYSRKVVRVELYKSLDCPGDLSCFCCLVVHEKLKRAIQHFLMHDAWPHKI